MVSYTLLCKACIKRQSQVLNQLHPVFGGAQKRMEKLSSTLKVFLQIALLGIFLVFFGFPAIEKYQKKETIIVSSEKFTHGIVPPALTIMGIQNSGLGWQGCLLPFSFSHLAKLIFSLFQHRLIAFEVLFA